jgi:probable HAF family extracellular repeat protein
MQATTKSVCTVLSICCFFAPLVAPAAQYMVTDLGTLGGTFSIGFGINAAGQVAGVSDPPGSLFRAFSYDGTMHNLGSLGGLSSYGYDINDAGHVTGHSLTSGNAADHAFLHNGTTMHDLGTLGGTDSVGNGINNSGHVTGRSHTSNNEFNHAFLYDGTMHDLGTLGGPYSEGIAINNVGQVTGVSSLDVSGPQHSFIWTPSTPNGSTGSFLDLGTLGGGYSTGININDIGQVTGGSQTVSGEEHAFLFDGTSMHDLGTLGGTGSLGAGINNHSAVVGWSYILSFDNERHAFLYTSATGMVDLNSLIDGFSGWILQNALAINDTGQITGDGFINGQQHAFLLTPVPEPTTATLLIVTILAMCGRRCAGVS